MLLLPQSCTDCLGSYYCVLFLLPVIISANLNALWMLKCAPLSVLCPPFSKENKEKLSKIFLSCSFNQIDFIIMKWFFTFWKKGGYKFWAMKAQNWIYTCFLSECWNINKILFVKYSTLLMLLLLPSWRSLDQLISVKIDFILWWGQKEYGSSCASLWLRTQNLNHSVYTNGFSTSQKVASFSFLCIFLSLVTSLILWQLGAFHMKLCKLGKKHVCKLLLICLWFKMAQ